MDPQETARILTYHRRRAGLAPLKELGWRTPESQRLRFDALCRWGALSDLAVMDLGCGHGDLLPYLNGRFADISYLGVDLLPEFVEEAARRHGHLPNVAFLQADFLTVSLPEADVVFACGSLNYKTENVLHPFQAIARMWEIARRGVAFNALDADVFEPDTFLQAHDRDELFSFCRNLDPEATLITDYSPEDFTILMHK
jgi:trans-aconitate methyltransferase